MLPILERRFPRELDQRRDHTVRRRLVLPVRVDSCDISASFEDGVLTVSLRKDPRSQRRRIRID